MLIMNQENFMNPEQEKREFINAYQSLFANDKKKEMENEAAKLKQALYERKCNLNKNLKNDTVRATRTLKTIRLR